MFKPIKTTFKKVHRGRYKIVDTETKEELGEVWKKPKSGCWAAKTIHDGIIGRFYNSRKHALDYVKRYTRLQRGN